MADPVKTVAQTTGDGVNANFAAYTIQVPGTAVAQYAIGGNIQARGPDGNAPGTLYNLTPNTLGPVAIPTAGTVFVAIQGQLTGGTVSLQTASTAYVTPASGWVTLYQQSLVSTDTSPAANTIWTMPTQW